MLKGQYTKVLVIWISPACLRPVVFKKQPDAVSVMGNSLASPSLHSWLSLLFLGPLVCTTVLCVHVCAHTDQLGWMWPALSVYCSTVYLLTTSGQMVGGQSLHNSREGHPHPHAFALCPPHSQAKRPGGIWELSPHLPEPRSQPALFYFITK